MYCFICRHQPLSINSLNTKKTNNYRKKLKQSLNKFNKKIKMYDNDIYGIIYYFYKDDLHLDADNISKPIWDALKDTMYTDDEQVKLRTSGAINLNLYDLYNMDTEKLQTEILDALLVAYNEEDHFIYIECGHLDINHFKFNIE